MKKTNLISGFTLLVLFIFVTSLTGADGEEILVDFSSAYAPPPAAWNVIPDGSRNGPIGPLLDVAGSSTAVIYVGTGWAGSGTSKWTVGDQAWIDAKAANDCFAGGEASMIFSNLSNDNYTVELVSSYNADVTMNVLINGIPATSTGHDFGSSINWNFLNDGYLEGNWMIWENLIPEDGTIDITFSSTVGLCVANCIRLLGSDVPLPVVLSSFYSTSTNNTSVLHWATQSEVENQGWNIYRSNSESLTQSMIVNDEGMITAAGTTTEPTEYTFTDPYPLLVGTNYWYWIESISFFGESEIFGPISLTIPNDEPGQNTPISPEEFGLHQNYPNPFNPNTEISFALEEESKVELVIYDVKGKKIKTLFTGNAEADRLYNFLWNGVNENGKSVASGIYFYKLETGTKIETKRMLLVK